MDLLVATILAVFVLATLKSIPDVTQVAQLGRYYLPVYVLAMPTAVAGVLDWLDRNQVGRRAWAWLAASFVALVWADPTWAYDASWLVKPYQLHWPALRAAGDWIKSHPDRVPPDARIMTWFPWELRVASDRTTILLPRNYSPRRINEVIRQYRVTHFLWGSFEPPPHVDPETWGPYLDQVRIDAWADLAPRALPFAAGTAVLPGPALSASLRGALMNSAGRVTDASGSESPRAMVDRHPACAPGRVVWYRAHTFAPTIAAATRSDSLAGSRSARPSRSTATRRPMPTSAIACSGATSCTAT